MWVFTYKFDVAGLLTKFKARLVVRGDMQRDSVYTDNYAATLAARTFRALMAIAVAFDLEAQQFDVVNAFTNSTLDETVYCDYPNGFKEQRKCLLLRRALYSLRRSPLLWLRELSSTLKSMGLTPVPEHECLFANDWLLVFFYVDDITALHHQQHHAKFLAFKQDLLHRYEMHDLGELKWFLGIHIVRDRTNCKLWLCQDFYIGKIAKTFHVDSQARYPDTPLITSDIKPYSDTATAQDIYAYQRKVGSVLYATTVTRPDVARAVNKLAEFMLNPGPQHHAAIDRALAYLYATRFSALQFMADTNSQQVFLCARDAVYGDDTQTRRSTEGYLFKLFGGPVDWRSTRQKTVTTTSTEAEFLSLSHAAKELYG
jgi:hypothetical protein